jgi:Aspartyl protease
VTHRPTLGAAFAALAFAAPSYAQVTGTNSAVEDNVQTIEQFLARWNNLLDRAAKARNIQHYCADGLCAWEWELRPRVQAKMVESNNGTHQAFYCFLAEPATTWDCYGNTLQRWVWNPQGGDAAVAQGDDTPANTPAPVVDPNAVPIFTDGTRAHVSAMIGSISATMLIDTGASVASVNASVAQALLASGEAIEAGQGAVGLAGGQTVTEDCIIIRQIALGTHVATNVPAVINANDDDMLLSLPALNQMGKFTIDTANSQLVFG